LINDILDLSKIEAGKLEMEYMAFHPKVTFEEMELIFSQQIIEKKLDFRLEVDPLLPKALLLDEVRLRQILLNLLGNAIKFTQVGTITLSVHQRILLDDASLIDLIFSVTDTGIGIPQDQLQSIFGAFEQRKGQKQTQYGGTGLGLNITKRLVEMMGGKVEVSSEEGKGSQFRVVIEDVAVSSIFHLEEEKQALVVDSIQFEQATILLVDDISNNRKLVREFLECYSFDFIEAPDGLEALNQVKHTIPDLILMDYQMPILNGYEAAKRLKNNEHCQMIPIIALTASAAKDANGQFRDICDGYLQKPVSQSQLIHEISRFLPHQVKSTGQQTQPQASREEKKVEEKPLLDSITLEKLPKLLVLLEQQHSTWEKLQLAINIRAIKAFATQIQQWGEEFNYSPLKIWGEALGDQADQYDLETLPKTLDCFTEVVQTLHSLIEPKE
jgi:CheY-like chemotaxis protein